MAIARQSDMSQSTIASTFQNKSKMMEAVKRSTELKATRLMKILRRASNVYHGDTLYKCINGEMSNALG